MTRARRATFFVLLALTLTGGRVEAQGTPMPFVRVQFFDNSGNPCNGCLLNAYAAGTNTRQDTFSDVTLLVANLNPVQMDSAGRPTSGAIYLSATSYRFVLTDSTGSTTYFDADNTPAIPSTQAGVDIPSQTAGEALAAGNAVYLSDGSGAKTAGRWYKADSGNPYSSSVAGIVGFATNAIASAASGTIRIGGRVTGLSGLTTGEDYYIGVAGALTVTPATNARYVGRADTTSTINLSGGAGAVRLPDTDGTNSVIVRTSSDLTADRLLTIVPGDAARTVTLTGDATLNQDVSTAGSPSFNFPGTPCGRLTGTTATPVTTSDVTGVASIFYTPNGCNTAAVFDGSSTWTTLTFSEITISVAACTASKPYDVFIFNNSGTLAAEILVWTNDTTRATALTLQNGVPVKTGATTRRYVGSFYCNSSGGQTDDSAAKRMLFNQYNRAMRTIRVQDNTNSWNYTTATWRQARATTSNQVDLMVGQNEDAIYAAVVGQFSNTNAGVESAVGIGLDSTTAPTTSGPPSSAFSSVANYYMQTIATYSLTAGVGKHSLVWLEISVATGTTTWGGSRNAFTGTMNSGIFGFVRN